jgi:stage V sporulation protein D (sporulation-specific penicillin-binding protein)
MKVKRNTNRIKFLRFCVISLFIIIFGRVGFLQVVDAGELSKEAIDSRTSERRIEPQRGTITDVTGKVLAKSILSKCVFVEPKAYRDGIENLKLDPGANLLKLAEILQLDPVEMKAKFASTSSWVALARQVELVKVNQIKQLGLPGVGFSDDTRRVYPMGNILAPILGIVNMDAHGAEGIELSYDQQLYGQKGFISEETDAKARSLIGGVHSYQAPVDGSNLALTIDSNIQYIVEQQLDDIVNSTKPQSTTIIVMDPKTGRILAMGNRPSFDPNDYKKFPEPTRRNLAITTQYEPGSTFKIITAASALEEGTTNPNKSYNDPGYLPVGEQRITNWDTDMSEHGDISLTKGMQLSSNVVMAQVGLELGRETFFKYIRGFGFGQKTGIDLPGEAIGQLLKEQKTSRFEQATMSFGQANAATPMQMITAISAVANGGTLYKPYIVDKITDSNGNVVTENKPTALRQVISKTTSDQMRDILEKVVSEGTGQTGKIDGYRVAGKTGTAQKVDETGKYSTKDFVASFVGFAPAEDPRVAVLVIIDSPEEGGIHQGGVLAGPRVKEIIQKSLQYLGVPPSYKTGKEVPFEVQPTEKYQPKPVIPERTPIAGEGVVPDLTGRTMSEAGEMLSKQGLRMNFVGTGLVSSQDPPPGKVLPAGSIINIKFEP